MPHRILYIVNPISGTQRKLHIAEQALSLTSREVYSEVALRETAYAGHAEHLAREAVDEGFDVVVAVGGDGTVNEVGRALVHTDTALAVLPCGSGNGLARHIGMPLNAKEAIRIINQHVVHTLDYGVINAHPFFCTCGVGFDAFICERFARAGSRGLKTYVENTLRAGLTYSPQTYSIEIDAYEPHKANPQQLHNCKAFLIACANASQYGNDAMIAPFASMKDGLMDVVLITPFKTYEAPQVALQLFQGTLMHNNHVQTYRTHRLHITREGEGVAHCDGDPFVTGNELDIHIEPAGLHVVVNAHKKRRHQNNLLHRSSSWLPQLMRELKQSQDLLLRQTEEDIKKLTEAWKEKFKNGG